MSRIAKADVNRALQLAAKAIVDAGGTDGRTSRAEMKARLATIPSQQRPLVDIFFKFIDNRDFKAGAQVTAQDVSRAVEYAKTHMVAKYDLDNNGLSKSEISKMSLTGKRAVELAKALKTAGGDTALSVEELGKRLKVAAKDADYISETDSTPAPVAGRPATTAGVTTENVKAAFGGALLKAFNDGGDPVTMNDLAFDIDSAADSKKFLTDLCTAAPDDDELYKTSAEAFKGVVGLLEKNLADVRVVKVGPKDTGGGLASDSGLYQYLLVGKAKDGQLAGVMFASVET